MSILSLAVGKSDMRLKSWQSNESKSKNILFCFSFFLILEIIQRITDKILMVINDFTHSKTVVSKIIKRKFKENKKILKKDNFILNVTHFNLSCN